MRGHAIIHNEVLYIFDGNPDKFDEWRSRLTEVKCRFTIEGFDDAEGIIKIIQKHNREVLAAYHEEDPDAIGPVINYY
jgi:hypothetical protein